MSEPEKKEMITIPALEYSKLHQQIGFLEGFLTSMELLESEELGPAIQRGLQRYREILAQPKQDEQYEQVNNQKQKQLMERVCSLEASRQQF